MAKNDDIHIGNEQVEEALRQGILAVDPDRAAGLGLLLQLTQARDAGLAREQERLRKSGRSPERAETIGRKLEASAVLNRSIEAEIKRMDTRPPRPNSNAWTLQGRVLVDDPRLLLDKAVALSDEDASKLEGTESDLEDGRFEIVYRVEQPRPRTSRAQSRARRAAEEAPAEEAPDTEEAAGRQVFVCILDQGRIVYRDPRPLKAENGAVAYVEIDLTTPPAVRTARERAAAEPSPPQNRQSRRARGKGAEPA